MSAPYTSRAPGREADFRGAAQARPKRRTWANHSLGGFEGTGQRKPSLGGVGKFSALHYDPVTGRKLA